MEGLFTHVSVSITDATENMGNGSLRNFVWHSISRTVNCEYQREPDSPKLSHYNDTKSAVLGQPLSVNDINRYL